MPLGPPRGFGTPLVALGQGRCRVPGLQGIPPPRAAGALVAVGLLGGLWGTTGTSPGCGTPSGCKARRGNAAPSSPSSLP